MKATREKVYKIINKERDYQTNKWGPLQDEKTSLSDFICYIQGYATRSQIISQENNPDEVLNNMRIIATLAVAAMEKFGVRER